MKEKRQPFLKEMFLTATMFYMHGIVLWDIGRSILHKNYKIKSVK